jgi:hypothetical protein
MILAIAEHVAGNHTFPGIAGLNGCGSETKNSDLFLDPDQASSLYRI